MIALYNKYIKLGKTDEEAIITAGKDAVWLLKRVIYNDNRTFRTRKSGFTRVHSWDGNRSNDNS